MSQVKKIKPLTRNLVKSFNLGDKLHKIYKLIDQGIPPSHVNKEGKEENSICANLGVSPYNLSYYLKILRVSGFIEKIGMIWIIRDKFDESKLKKSTRVDSNNPLTLKNLPRGKNRGHGFQFKVFLPSRIPRWTNEKRRKAMDKLGADWYPLNHLVGSGEGIIFRGRKVHLTNSSIIIYEKASYIAEFAKISKSHAVYDFLKLVRAIEKSLRANLFQGSKIRWKVTRQHHAIVKNSLAKQYNRNHKKLHIYTGRGLIFLIDNSFDLDEFEAVHPKTSVEDMDDKVIPFFKSLDKNPITTDEIFSNFEELKQMMKKSSETQMMTGQVMQQMEKNLIHLTKIVMKGGDKNAD